jgi:hypothetical protein
MHERKVRTGKCEGRGMNRTRTERRPKKGRERRNQTRKKRGKGGREGNKRKRRGGNP